MDDLNTSIARYMLNDGLPEGVVARIIGVPIGAVMKLAASTPAPLLTLREKQRLAYNKRQREWNAKRKRSDQ